MYCITYTDFLGPFTLSELVKFYTSVPRTSTDMFILYLSILMMLIDFR